MFRLDRDKQSISIEGDIYFPDSFRGNNIPSFADKSDFHFDLYLFLKDWFAEDTTIKVQTSGSTGTPKEMNVEKEKMMQSARLTCLFLGLKECDTALLCMSLKYIAGKMMVVRALVCGLDLYLISPCGNPLKNTDISFDFAAMIPLQVYNSLNSLIEKERLASVKNLIIGGGAIDAGLEKALKDFTNDIYSTYGMTETLSHIALRRLTGVERTKKYQPFESVSLSLSDDETLIIKAPLVSDEVLYTNDIAEIHSDGSFIIKGRKDNVINSGGIKIQVEEVEVILRTVLKGSFAITSLPDTKFGEIVVLVLEEDINQLDILNILPDYYQPKKIIRIPSIPLTETGKISRLELKKYILLNYNN